MTSNLINQTTFFFKKEFYADWKNKTSITSLLLMIFITVFIVYKIVEFTADEKVWHALFYVLIIFGVLQNVSRSFLNEKKGIIFYYAQIVNPKALILAKMSYQITLNTVFLGILYLTFSFLIPHQIEKIGLYLITAWLFSTANCAIFTFNSAVSIGAKNAALLAQILSLPLLIPTLLITISIAAEILSPMNQGIPYQGWMILLSLNVIIVLLGVILYEQIWRE